MDPHGRSSEIDPSTLSEAERRLIEANEFYTGGQDRTGHKLASRADAPVAVDVEPTAEELKEMGNARFAKGDDAGASGLYTRALKRTEDRGLRRVLYSNRSAARLRGGDPEGALVDAEDCLRLGPGWVKGLARKGLALVALSRFEDALNTFNEALAVEPNNETLITGKKRAQDGIDGTGEFAHKEEADPLASLFSSVADIEKTVPKRFTAIDHEKETEGWTRENQVERILQPHHKFLNLNPFQVFGMGISANEEDVKKRFHKLSSLVHPDKNPDPRAREAFEIVKNAEGELKNPERKSLLLATFHECRLRVEARRTALRKKLKISEEDLAEKEGPLEAEVDKEIKTTLAANEQDRIRAEKLRQRNEEFLAQRSKKEEPNWTKVKQHEDEFKQGADDRLKSWADFAKKQKKV